MNNSISFPSEIFSDRLIDRLAYAHDASMYRVVPQGVIRPRNESEIIGLFKYGNNTQTPITFRTAGTSLSGQAVGNGMIAEIVRDWKKWKILDNGASMLLQPGVIGGHANTYLMPFHRKIGPDPASINSCMIGGIIANNSSGMACGVKNNAYHTLKSIRFILPDGQIYDTKVKADYHRFSEEQPLLAEQMSNSRKYILDHEDILNKIRRKYLIKNTMGYSMNAFADYVHPLDIFAHLLVGSEGTLAFISEVELWTIPELPFKSTALILFDNIYTASSTISYLTEKGATAVEIMDYASLKTVKYLKEKPYDVSKLMVDQAGILCEYECEEFHELTSIVKNVNQQIQNMGGVINGDFSTDAHYRDNLWKIRKGLYPTVGSLRKKGTSVITEDICVQPADLPEMMSELHKLFHSWRFDDAVVFGHAKDGNLHFVTSIDLNDKGGMKRMEGMMTDLVSLTLSQFDGSLKAEHGTGRNMAPFVKAEWGDEIYEIMWAVKRAVDPKMILNPGVLLNRDPKTHVKDLKPLPLVNETVDLCVECGFCDHVCPSKSYTMTPRQRIAVLREMQILSLSKKQFRQLKADFSFSGEQTCVTDGLCAIQCPVKINTGSLIKDIRHQEHSWLAHHIANLFAGKFSIVQNTSRQFLKLKKILDNESNNKLINLLKLKFILHKNMVKSLTKSKGQQGKILFSNISLPSRIVSPAIKKYQKGTGKKIVYFPSCLNRTISSANGLSNVNMLMELAPEVNIELIIPETISSLCCGMPFSSKGYTKAHETMMNKTIDALDQNTHHGEFPVLMDMSPCTMHITEQEMIKNKQLQFIDIVDLFHSRKDLMKRVHPAPAILMHPTCSMQKMEQEKKMIEILRALTEKVILPIDQSCCGAGGDRSLFYPELGKSATKNLLDLYPKYPDNAIGVSTSAMCEIALSESSKVKFISLIELIYTTQKASKYIT